MNGCNLSPRNLTGAFLCIQAAAAALTASGRGRIIGIASDVGRRGAPLLQAYSASKFGLIGLIQSVAAELAPHVTANAVCPVSTPATGMGQQLLAWKLAATGKSESDLLEDIANTFPLGRAGTPQDISECVAFLVSDASSFITGSAMDVDGGSSLHKMPGIARRNPELTVRPT